MVVLLSHEGCSVRPACGVVDFGTGMMGTVKLGNVSRVMIAFAVYYLSTVAALCFAAWFVQQFFLEVGEITTDYSLRWLHIVPFFNALAWAQGLTNSRSAYSTT